MKYIKTYEEQEDKSKITKLDLFGKKLTELPDLSEYTNLRSLLCSDNQLTSLPELPDSLVNLNCSNNQLTSLPELPDSLEQIYCYNNKLTSLPELPDSLKRIYCYNNQLTSLPELPDSLERFYCLDNNLPFNDLNEYKKWYAENKQLIDKEGLEHTYHLYNSINKYNL